MQTEIPQAGNQFRAGETNGPWQNPSTPSLNDPVLMEGVVGRLVVVGVDESKKDRQSGNHYYSCNRSHRAMVEALYRDESQNVSSKTGWVEQR